MKKILITGINGQDGIILSNILNKNKFQVFGFVNKKSKEIKNPNIYNIKNRKFKFIKKLLDKITPDVIVHLGSTNPSYSKTFKKIDYLFNVKITKFLINYITQKKIKFIFPSSSVVFRKMSKKITENSQTKVTSYYAKFRIKSMEYLLAKKKQKKLNASIVILFNHDSKFRNKRFLLPRLIGSIKQNKIGFLKEIYKQNINGDFAHADDICNAIYLLISKNLNPDKIILSSGKRTYVNDTIDYFIPNFKYRISNIQLNNFEGIIGNNTKAKKILHWKLKKKHLDAAKEIYKS